MNAKSFTALLAGAGLLAVASAGQTAQQPTQADFEACNKEAQAKAGGAPAASPSTGTSPSTGVGSGATTGGGATTPGGGATTSGGGATTSGSSDQQLQGMAAAGQSDPAYQQAYRECLQRRGF